jgi:hypothetical protein
MDCAMFRQLPTLIDEGFGWHRLIPKELLCEVDIILTTNAHELTWLDFVLEYEDKICAAMCRRVRANARCIECAANLCVNCYIGHGYEFRSHRTLDLEQTAALLNRTVPYLLQRKDFLCQHPRHDRANGQDIASRWCQWFIDHCFLSCTATGTILTTLDARVAVAGETTLEQRRHHTRAEVHLPWMPLEKPIHQADWDPRLLHSVDRYTKRGRDQHRRTDGQD